MEQYIVFLQSYTWFDNTLYDYAAAFLWFVGLLVGLKIFQYIFLKRLETLSKRTKTQIDDMFVEFISGIRPPVYMLLAFYVAYRTLSFPGIVDSIVGFVVFVLVVYEAIALSGKVIDFYTERYTRKISGDAGQRQARAMMQVLKMFIIIGLWAVGVLLILSNYGVNVTSLIASLGIVGIAVALALQNILSDVFSSFSIFIDKPFQLGDFIIVGQDMGTVQKIGIKSTRIKTLQGQELVISNKELTTARVQNYAHMERRRVPVTISVVYGTPKTKLEKIPAMLEKIVSGMEQTTFDRCHFKTYGMYSLDFELIYFVESADYVTHMDINQAINLAVYEAFEKEKIAFAHATQTAFVQK